MTEVMMKQLILSSVLVVLLLGAVGCETIKGAGRDITNAGEAIEDAVR